MLQSRTETTMTRYMLILVCMLMRCLRNSGFDRRQRQPWQCEMSREEEPSFVINDPRYVKESTNSTSLLHIFNGRWLVGLGVNRVIAMSLVFGQLICIPTRLASSFLKVSSELLVAHTHIWSNDGGVIRIIEISELVFTELYPEATTTQQPTH